MTADSATSTRTGLLVGVVTDLDDPDKLARVRVSFPELGGVQSDWAGLVTLMAGDKRGSLFRPEKGDEVIVGFLQGDMRAPYVLGGVWNQPEPPPPDDGKPTENNWRFFTSRSGHVLRFDDTKGAEKIEVIDKDGKRRVVLDSANSKITVSADEGDVEVDAPNGTIKLSGRSIELHATTTLSLTADQGLTISGKTVDIN
ncbi:phage baseplate assembly protein V [Kutzneria sp. CA-103260]|uniref:phage baseplate assembly protein V n=1 Tax=Kutzneria sp. CA-103260 TaxID=2802641 RepID=UPI001BA78C3C|nr:phage baseplate assembly protein V [Kutzneria sp. CA-103260]QUQ65636.1 rhs element Vgr protein [Kutzneria sp. CA-103260]